MDAPKANVSGTCCRGLHAGGKWAQRGGPGAATIRKHWCDTVEGDTSTAYRDRRTKRNPKRTKQCCDFHQRPTSNINSLSDLASAPTLRKDYKGSSPVFRLQLQNGHPLQVWRRAAQNTWTILNGVMQTAKNAAGGHIPLGMAPFNRPKLAELGTLVAAGQGWPWWSWNAPRQRSGASATHWWMCWPTSSAAAWWTFSEDMDNTTPSVPGAGDGRRSHW